MSGASANQQVVWARDHMSSPSGDSYGADKGVYVDGVETVPAAPAHLYAYAAGEKEIGLTWGNVPDNEDEFVIERRVTGTENWAEVGRAREDSPSFVDSTPDFEQLYDYRVHAENAAGASSAAVVTGYSNLIPALLRKLQELTDEQYEIATKIASVSNALTATYLRATSMTATLGQANLYNTQGNVLAELITPALAAEVVSATAGSLLDTYINPDGIKFRDKATGRFAALSQRQKAFVKGFARAGVGIAIAGWAAEVMLRIADINTTAAALDEVSTVMVVVHNSLMQRIAEFNAVVEEGARTEALILEIRERVAAGNMTAAEARPMYFYYKQHLIEVKQWRAQNEPIWSAMESLAAQLDALLDQLRDSYILGR